VSDSARSGEAAVPALLQFHGLSKAFPNVQALNDVSFDVRAGEVLALMGENGAGKSTLLKILSGDYQQDEGHLTLGGEQVQWSDTLGARRAGVRVVYQEPEVIPDVSVAENIYLGELPRRGPLVNHRQLQTQVREDLARHGFAGLLRPEQMGNELSPAQRQIIEIVRALKPGVRVVAFDEPTSSLTDDEVESLFELIDRLRSEGLGIIYVSHRLDEILRIADRVAVLRDGKMVGVRDAATTTDDDIVRLMVGRDLSETFARSQREIADVVLEVEHLTTRWHRDISFEVRAGEVVGFAGLVGAGRTELAKVLFGDEQYISGEIRVEGAPLKAKWPADAIDAGVALAPEERKGEGLILIRSVAENASLAILRRLARMGFVDRAKERSSVTQYIDQLDVKTPSIDQEVGKLSGGNQQKVVLARWLASSPKLLILDEPTRGIDVGAKAEIYRLIEDLAGQGLAIIVISSELSEVLGLSDRILVMGAGRITGELSAADATSERILELAMLNNETSTTADEKVRP
jgi:ABC-type sugar transport system ATPase subunit